MNMTKSWARKTTIKHNADTFLYPNFSLSSFREIYLCSEICPSSPSVLFDCLNPSSSAHRKKHMFLFSFLSVKGTGHCVSESASEQGGCAGDQHASPTVDAENSQHSLPDTVLCFTSPTEVWDCKGGG